MQKQNYEQMIKEIEQELQKHSTSQGWEAAATEGNCKGFKKDNGNGQYITKGEMVMDYPIDKIFDVLKNPETFKKMNDRVLEDKVLEQTPTYRIQYRLIKTPFPTDNRDLVLIHTHLKSGNKFYVGGKSCDFQYPAQKGVVRAKNLISGWVMESAGTNKTKITHVSDIDPMGSIPDILKKQMIKERCLSLVSLDKYLKTV